MATRRYSPWFFKLIDTSDMVFFCTPYLSFGRITSSFKSMPMIYLIITIISSMLCAPALAKESLVDTTIDVIEREYLWTEDLVADQALIKAAESLESSIPWLIVDHDESRIKLSHGEYGIFATLPQRGLTYQRLSAQLHELARLIKESSYPLEDDLDLEVVMLRGVARTLDRYSTVMYKESLRRFNERIRGKLSGIGCRIQAHERGLRIRRVFKGGPAEKVGVMAEDIITHVDGSSIRGVTVKQGGQRLRGTPGTRVEVQLLRGDQVLKKTIVRRYFRIPNLHWTFQDDGIGVIKIKSFSNQTMRWLKQALAEFEQTSPHTAGDHKKRAKIHTKSKIQPTTKAQTKRKSQPTKSAHAKYKNQPKQQTQAEEMGPPEKETKPDKLRGIIIDLRGNSGGSLIQSCKVIDAFVREGLGLRTAGRGGKSVPKLIKKYTFTEADEPEVPIVVLVNQKSASASEIVAGSFKLAERGLLIGTQTFGKGVIQKPHRVRKKPVDERVTLKLTVAQYLLAGDYSVHDQKGVAPHILVTPHIFGKYRAYLPQETEGSVYAVEREGWREASPEPRDFVMEFAQRLLNQDDLSPKVSLMEREARKLLAKLESEERERIIELYQTKEIDWSFGESSPKFEDLEVTIKVSEQARAGETTKVIATVINRGDVPLRQARVYLKTDHSKLPWSGVMISVGRVSPGASVSGSAEVPISSRLVSRVDSVQPTLVAEHFEPQQLTPQEFSVIGATPARLSAEVYITSRDQQHILHVSLKNTSDRPLKDLRVRLGLPNDKALEFKSDGTVELPEIEPNQTRDLTFLFSSTKSLAQIKPLQLQVDTRTQRKVISADIIAVKIKESTLLSPPRVNSKISQRLSPGEHHISLELIDDREIRQTTVWLDREKIAWRSARARWRLPITLTPGIHHLKVIVEDDQELVTRRLYPIWVPEVDPTAK